MSKKRQRKSVHPLLALGLLALGVAVFAVNVAPLLQGGDVGGSASPAPLASEDAAPEPAAEDELGDLLAQFGSYAPGTAVRQAFGRGDGIAAAPAVETAPVAGAWQGDDPPQLHLGFLMLGGAVARAVVDGAIVGIGDPVAGGSVAAIHKDCVVLRLGARTLTYDMDTAWPREFGRELQRRSATAGKGSK